MKTKKLFTNRAGLGLLLRKHSIQQPRATTGTREPLKSKETFAEKSSRRLGQTSSSTTNDIDSSRAIDFTKVPSTLDEKFEEFDTDSALRPTIIDVGERWEKRSFRSLRGRPVENILGAKERDDEKTKCFDLLDALSCSGSLEIDGASLHVVLAATHCFEETVINTVVRKNMNPIEKLERSLLIVASTIQGKPAGDLVRPTNLAQIQNHSPQLLHVDDDDEEEEDVEEQQYN